jgi:hypothetical protein
MVLRGYVRTATKRRMRTERGWRASSREDMILHDFRRKDEVVVRKTCGNVVMKFFQRGVRRERRDTCVWRGLKLQ